ncbi:MAG TPA: glycosyltransferase family 4 protein [Polyangia bacterium]|jgi:glycosyltransferase involved in cell wall biosynthesis|nr:glycosyltransferase family 4 protein [Polyangia bacterium]
MSRIRIATLVTELGAGGDEHRSLEFARCLDQDRFEHLMISIAAPDPAQALRAGPVAGGYRELGVRCLSLGVERRWEGRPLPRPLPLAREGLQTARLARALGRLLRRERIDVLDARTHYAIAVGLLGARLGAVPVVMGTEYCDPFWSREPWRSTAPAIFDGLDVLVSDSRWAIEELRRRLGRPLAHAAVVPHGMEPPAAELDRRSVREGLGLPTASGIRVVAQIGRLVPSQGHRVFLDAAARVARALPDVYFLLCGQPGSDRAYVAELQTFARTLGVAGRVRITGYAGPIGDVWNAVDVHAHAALSDASPLGLYESMALGLPAVVTAVGGVPELLSDGVTGLLVPPGDAAALTGGLLRLLGDPRLAQRLGAAARRRHRQWHRPEVMTRALEDLMRAALDRRRGGPGAQAPQEDRGRPMALRGAVR